jgi:hypothetical protein
MDFLCSFPLLLDGGGQASGGLAMASYQVHLLDVFGRIVRTIEVECDDDDQARVLAEDQTRLVSTELWQGDRLIERYDSVLEAFQPQRRQVRCGSS